MILLAFITPEIVLPILVFGAIVCMTYFGLSALSKRNSQAEDRLTRISRPKSIDTDSLIDSKTKFNGLKDAFSNLGASMQPKSELEQNSLKVKLANAGFRSEAAATIYLGLRVATMAIFLIPTLIWATVSKGFTLDALYYIVFITGLGFYIPNVALALIIKDRKQKIFLVVGSAAVVTGGVLYFLGAKKSQESSSVTFVPTESGASFAWTRGF